MRNVKMSFNFAGKLCQKKEPERGCLARPYPVAPPKNSCPILDLPAEIRAQIFEYLISDDELLFRFSKVIDESSCWSCLPEYKSNLAFLEASKLFEAEALALVKVRYIRIRVEQAPEESPKNPKMAALLKKHQRSTLCDSALSLGHVRPHLKQLSVDSKYTLPRLLETSILDNLPKLRHIQINQEMCRRPMDHGYREMLNTNTEQLGIISESLGHTFFHSSRRRLRCSCNEAPLHQTLQNQKLARFYPIRVHTRASSSRCYARGEWLGDDDSIYPIIGAISALRMSYMWPSEQVVNFEVDMYNQPMSLAVKSQWTEQIAPTKEKAGDRSNTSELA